MNRITLLLLLLPFVAATNAALAQGGYEEQSLAILKLYESGEKGKRDSAYKLIDRLKTDNGARFVPVVLFVRGEMTPDNRSLNLYREVIALDPGGQWADDAAAALACRYVANRDSLGAHVWLSMLKSNYPRSPLAGSTEDSVEHIHDWKLTEVPATSPKTGVAPKNDTARSQVRKPAPSAATTQSSVRRDSSKTTTPTSTAKKPPTTTKPPTSTTSGTAKPSVSKKPATPKPPTTSATKTTAKPTAATKPTTKPTTKPKPASKPATPKPATDTAVSKLRGYALQVGVFPSKEAAQPRLTELQQKKMQVYALPKFIEGKKQYAVIVGPYPTLEDAENHKAEIAKACNCQAFIVKVE